MSDVYSSEANLLTKTINKQISRRSFLKWSAAIGATTSVAGLISQKNQKAEATYGDAAPVTGSPLNWMPTTCLVCHGWDGKAIGVNSSKCVVKIEGMGGQKSAAFSCDREYAGPANTYDPDLKALINAKAANTLRYYPGTRGKICAKGSNGMEHMYDPDRVKFPLVRVGARGAGNWRRTSWKEALRLAGVAIIDARGTKYDGGGFSTANTWRAVATPADATKGRNPQNVFVWRGRDEMGEHGYTGRFTNSIGGGSVAHTSLCEVSRHAAYATMYDHHFPMPDANNHDDVNQDCDVMVEFGGNGVEQKIPAYMTAQRWGDRRARGCRIISADPRQSNSSAFADEWIQMRPGTDGALAIGICHTIMTADSTVHGGFRTLASGWSAGAVDLLIGNYSIGGASIGWEGTNFPGGTYANIAGGGGHVAYGPGAAGYSSWVSQNIVGLYPYEEEVGVTDPASNTTSVKIPVKESLFSYVRNAKAETLEGGNLERDKTWAALICDLPATTVLYLAKIFGHVNSGAGVFNKPQWNCYRGPCKHTNGTYATKAGECLNILSGATHTAGCGNSRHNWPEDTPHVHVHLNGGAAGDVGSNGDGGSAWDKWDFVNGRDAYKVQYAGVDQNVTPSLRVGVGIDTGIAPAYAYLSGVAPGSAILATYGQLAPKCLVIFKNAPTQTRGDVELDRQLLTDQWPTLTAVDWIDGTLGQYKLKSAISIDLNMGDGTRLMDIILPDGSYLERNDLGIVHTHAFAAFNLIRQPVLRRTYPPTYSNHDIITLHRVHQAQSIMRGISLAIDVEYACLGGAALGSVTARNWAMGSKSATPGEYFFWGSHTTYPSNIGGLRTSMTGPDDALDIAMMKEIDDAVDNYWLRIWGGSHTGTVVTGAFASYSTVGTGSRENSTTNSTAGVQYIQGDTAEDKYNWLMRNGSYWYTPASGSGGNWNQWIRGNMYGGKRDKWGHHNSTDRNKFINVYSHTIGRYSWSASTAPKFYGHPAYVPIETPPGTYTIGAGTQSYPIQHTTMKRNLHTQSRTASLPRLMEVLGSNPMWIHPTNATAAGLVDGDLVKVYLPRLSRGSNLTDGNSRTGVGGPSAGVAVRDGAGTSAAAGSPKFVWDQENFYVVAAHVTPRIRVGVVATSTSFGHSTNRDGSLDTANGQAFGSYTVDSANNRSVNASSFLSSGTTSVSVGSPYTVTTVAASAPGAGWNPNWGLHRLTDPLGCSLAWFDNVCRIVKL